MAEIAKTGGATTKAVAVAVMGGARGGSQATSAPLVVTHPTPIIVQPNVPTL